MLKDDKQNILSHDKITLDSSQNNLTQNLLIQNNQGSGSVYEQEISLDATEQVSQKNIINQQKDLTFERGLKSQLLNMLIECESKLDKSQERSEQLKQILNCIYIELDKHSQHDENIHKYLLQPQNKLDQIKNYHEQLQQFEKTFQLLQSAPAQILQSEDLLVLLQNILKQFLQTKQSDITQVDYPKAILKKEQQAKTCLDERDLKKINIEKQIENNYINDIVFNKQTWQDNNYQSKFQNERTKQAEEKYISKTEQKNSNPLSDSHTLDENKLQESGWKIHLTQQKKKILKIKILKKYKSDILDKFKNQNIYICKLLYQNENGDLFIGYEELGEAQCQDLVIKIRQNSTEKQQQEDISAIKSLKFIYSQQFVIESKNISLLVLQLNDCQQVEKKIKQFMKETLSQFNLSVIEINQFKTAEYFSRNQNSFLYFSKISKQECRKKISQKGDQVDNSFSIPEQIKDQEISQTQSDQKQNDILLKINEYNFSGYQNEQQNYSNYDTRQINNTVLRQWSKKIFENVNEGQILKEPFLSQQKIILKILKRKQYYLCKYFESNQQQTVFMGYKEFPKEIYEDYVFIIKFEPSELEINEYLIIRKDIYVQYNNIYSKLKPMIEWQIEQFNQINNEILNQKSCNQCGKSKQGE
ncbi:hypothetical protein ABPG72_021201 [Tetrahymena utriculariae]